MTFSKGCMGVCAVGGAYCSACGENAVKHITSQGNAHHKIHSVPADDEEKSIQLKKIIKKQHTHFVIKL